MKRVPIFAATAALVLAVLTVSTTSVREASATPVVSQSGGALVVERPGRVYTKGRGPDGNVQKLRMDLWVPVSIPRGDRPVVVLAHGGGFRMGHRKKPQIRRLARRFAEHGYVTASITYRLFADERMSAEEMVRSTAANKAKYDMRRAMRYLHRKQGHLGINTDRMAVLGASAGGITAFKAGLHRNSRADAVVSLWGIADPDTIRRDAPPVLMFHGKQDHVLPFRLARETCYTLRQRSTEPCSKRWWHQDGHNPWHRIDQIEYLTLRFLNRHMKG